MRKVSEVNAHRTQFREHARSNGTNIRMPRLLDAAQVQPVQAPYWWEKFLPRRESRVMSEEASRTGGIFLPWPLLGFILTLTLGLGGGLIGLYATVTTMNATMLMRDSDQREQIRKLENKLELQEMYTRDIREILAARGELKKKTN